MTNSCVHTKTKLKTITNSRQNVQDDHKNVRNFGILNQNFGVIVFSAEL